MMFQFKKSEKKLIVGGGINIASLLGIEDTQMYQAAFLGRCTSLFGEPNDTSADHENLYTYYIKAEADTGEIIDLEIYFGPSGPAIACHDGEIEEKAVYELAKKILATEPADCRIQSGYGDTSVRIIMGVENGEAFYKTLFPGMTEDMSDEEIEAAFRKLFGAE